ncbi:MAG: MerR family transcriptional regulator [Eubacteriales bacterium]|nr:MerR family transcriptional regulator [Eubacteriales bacterium]
MERKSTFRIGELSKLFDIGVDSIRYYEKVGILNPLRNEENNYRLYTIEDVRKLTMIRELLNLNFSTEQIKSFDDNRNVENTKELLAQELNILNEEIVKLYEKRNSIETRLYSLRRNLAKDASEQIKVLDLEERHCLMLSDTNLPDEYVDYYLVKYMHSQQFRIDTIGACDCYTLDMENSNPDSEYLRTKNVFFYSNRMLYHSNYVMPAGKYLSLSYRGSLRKTKQLVPKLYQYAKAHHLKVIGDPIEMCHIDDYETADENEYLTELQLAVK